ATRSSWNVSAAVLRRKTHLRPRENERASCCAGAPRLATVCLSFAYPRVKLSAASQFSAPLVWSFADLDGFLDGSSLARLVDLRADQFGAATRNGARHSSAADFVSIADRGERCRPILAQKADRAVADRGRLYVRGVDCADLHPLDRALACLFERLRDGDRSDFPAARARGHHCGRGAARSPDQCDRAQFDDLQYGAKHRTGARRDSDRPVWNGGILCDASDFLRARNALDDATALASAIVADCGRHFDP